APTAGAVVARLASRASGESASGLAAPLGLAGASASSGISRLCYAGRGWHSWPTRDPGNSAGFAMAPTSQPPPAMRAIWVLAAAGRAAIAACGGAPFQDTGGGGDDSRDAGGGDSGRDSSGDDAGRDSGGDSGQDSGRDSGGHWSPACPDDSPSIGFS